MILLAQYTHKQPHSVGFLADSVLGRLCDLPKPASVLSNLKDSNLKDLSESYHYNKNNQLEAVILPGTGQLAYSNFQWNQPQTLTLPGGNRIDTRYDPLQRQTQRSLFDAADTRLADYLYGYDNESNITGIQTDQGDYSFGYDSLYRLTSADYPSEWGPSEWDQTPQGSDPIKTESFGYDGVGNRTEHNTATTAMDGGSTDNAAAIITYNGHNQLSGQSDSDGNDLYRYTYNVNGHTVKRERGQPPQGSDPSVADYIYNVEERLIAVQHGGATVAQYAYDPYGRRISKTADGQTTYYFYTDQGLSAEYDGAGTLIKEYHYQPGGTWMTEPLFQRTADGKVYYYQNDHLGTPQRLIAASGAVVWAANYTAFGEANIQLATVENNLRFPGQYFDQETGLHQNYFRDYDPSTGRYIQSDPIGLLGGVNVYSYAYNNSLKYYDKYGLYIGIDDAIATGGGAVVGLIGQGVGDLFNWDLSGWEDYVGAAVGGAAGGEAFLYLGPLGAGVVGGAVTNATKQGLKNLTGKKCRFSYESFLWDAGLGGLTGLIPGLPKSGINVGRGSWNAISKRIITMLANGQISRISGRTLAKMFAVNLWNGAGGIGAGTVAG